MVNGPYQVYVERKGKVELTDVVFRDDPHVLHVATRIVTEVGRRVDESTPLVDARLKDGSRVNIIIPPLAIDGPTISIRKFSKKEITLDVMARQNNISPDMATVLKIAGRCRLNILISGGTGSGKTTLLNAMSRMIDHGERTVTIEDAAELQLQQPHVVRLETRPANIEGEGEITMRHLVKNALRMRPDRIILGEIRGEEAIDMLQAMNTGHDGSMGTIHSNTPRDALTRLENMVAMSGFKLPAEAVREQIQSAIHMIIQISRMRDGKRRITQVTEITGMEGEIVTTQDLFKYVYDGENADGTPLRPPRVLAPAPALHAARRILRPRHPAPGGDGMPVNLIVVGAIFVVSVADRDRPQPLRHHRRAADAAPAPQAPGAGRPQAHVGPARPRGRADDAAAPEAGEERPRHPDRRAGAASCRCSTPRGCAPTSAAPGSPGRSRPSCCSRSPSPRSPVVGVDLRLRPAVLRLARPRPARRHALRRPLREVPRRHALQPLHEAAPRRASTPSSAASAPGLPVIECIGSVGQEYDDPVGGHFQAISERVMLGEPLDAALWRVARVIDKPEMDFFAISIAIQVETGGSLVRRPRQPRRPAARARADEAQDQGDLVRGQASALIIGALPFLMLGLLMMMSPDYVMPLFLDPRGQMMLGAGLTSICLGAFVMWRMTQFEI